MITKGFYTTIHYTNTVNEKGDITINTKKIEEYIENKNSYWECFDENGQKLKIFEKK